MACKSPGHRHSDEGRSWSQEPSITSTTSRTATTLNGADSRSSSALGAHSARSRGMVARAPIRRRPRAVLARWHQVRVRAQDEPWALVPEDSKRAGERSIAPSRLDRPAAAQQSPVRSPSLPGVAVTLEQWQDDPDPQICQVLKVIARIVGVGGGAALGYLVHDSTGTVGAMAGEAIGTALERGVDRTMQFQVNQVGKMVSYAAKEARLSADELIDAADDPFKLSLLSQALSAAASTALESKLKVLDRLLVQGLLNEDQAKVDEARLLTATIDEIERPHLRILNYITKPYNENHSEDERATADAELPPEAEIPPDAWTLDRLK